MALSGLQSCLQLGVTCSLRMDPTDRLVFPVSFPFGKEPTIEVLGSIHKLLEQAMRASPAQPQLLPLDSSWPQRGKGQPVSKELPGGLARLLRPFLWPGDWPPIPQGTVRVGMKALAPRPDKKSSG